MFLEGCDIHLGPCEWTSYTFLKPVMVYWPGNETFWAGADEHVEVQLAFPKGSWRICKTKAQ